MRDKLICIGMAFLLLFSCKEECPLSDCPNNEVPIFSFIPLDDNGDGLYDSPNSNFSFEDLRIVAYFGAFSQELELDTSRVRVDKIRYFTITTSLPRASDRMIIFFRRNRFDEFKVQGTEAVDECCGSYYTGFAFSFEGQAISSFPYVHVVD